MSALSDWFANPVLKIKFEDSDEVTAIKQQLDKLELEKLRLQSLYAQECEINMRLMDILRSHGIKWR